MLWAIILTLKANRALPKVCPPMSKDITLMLLVNQLIQKGAMLSLLVDVPMLKEVVPPPLERTHMPRAELVVPTHNHR
jgi:hypothetical protein